MKGKKAVLLALILAGVLGSANVGAQHRHHHSRTSVGFVFGAPAYWPYYAPPPHPYPYSYYSYPYYYPPVIAVHSSPPVYVERSRDEAPAEYYWHFCSNPQGYYPYVRECKTNWQRVTPVPQGN